MFGFRRLTPLGKLVAAIIFLVLALIGGFFWLNNYIYQEKQGEPQPLVVEDFEGESAIRSITYEPTNILLGTDGNAELGTYLIGFNGRPVYTFDNDTEGVSTCINTCAETWPPYLIEDTEGLSALKSGVNGMVGTTTRADGSTQVTYEGSPLYFYYAEGQGTVLGEGVNGVWHVVKP